ncbi:Kelch repeat-containing protein [Hymenobacter properus]|uniref:T9SS type A sorting domain-containing protein n=1 Tax=Hymenobacter properus TaxID=2791026 RepID=A0A931FJU5_9BACT|nr:kelch repeat-containing protein [Hymenobacter properus]MBF9142288.1 T9SS type A sorting domain-containing protein [Hymenobacter properus]MBR7721095.1 T9SS type A sorting domain-containing protein [Microvirga sp. SRT04]
MINRYAFLLLALLSAGTAHAQTSLTFTALGSLPDGGRYGMAYLQDQSTLYMVGGGSPLFAFNATVYRYDISAGTWTTGPTGTGLTPQRFGSAALGTSASGSRLVYVFNGATASGGPVPGLQTLDVSTGNSGPGFANPMPASTAGVATINGLIYAIGGQLTNTTYTDALRRYSPATDTWTTLAPLPEAKSTVGVAVNGKIYAIGGYNGVVNSARVDAYDPATNTWQALGTLPTTVSSQAVAVQGEWIWMVGDFNVQNYLAAYNTRTGQLRTFTSNLPPRRNAAAAFVNGQLYVWGGNTASSNASTLADMWVANVSAVLTARTQTGDAPNLRAYPNPSANGLTSLELPTGTRTVEVFDALGRVVLSAMPAAGATSLPLDLRAQPVGLYVVRVHTADGRGVSCRVVRE